MVVYVDLAGNKGARRMSRFFKWVAVILLVILIV